MAEYWQLLIYHGPRNFWNLFIERVSIELSCVINQEWFQTCGEQSSQEFTVFNNMHRIKISIHLVNISVFASDIWRFVSHIPDDEQTGVEKMNVSKRGVVSGNFAYR